MEKKPLYKSKSDVRPECIAEVLNKFYEEGYHLKEIVQDNFEYYGEVERYRTYTILVVLGTV